MIKFNIISVFPEALVSYIKVSLIKKAIDKKIIQINLISLRKFGEGKHKKLDDRPFGGGPGMVLMFNPIAKAIRKLTINNKQSSRSKRRVILFSIRGKRLDSKILKRLGQYENLVLICGRYEGVDERVAKYLADEEISVGDYVLSGGELPAMVLIEGVSRYLSGFLGKYESLEDIKGSYPVYTKPEILKIGKRKLAVPKVLLSGHHKKIEEWRKSVVK